MINNFKFKFQIFGVVTDLWTPLCYFIHLFLRIWAPKLHLGKFKMWANKIH